MNPSVVAPHSSTLAILAGSHGDPIPDDGKSRGAGKQPAAKPDIFSVLLLLLFPDKAPPQLAAQGNNIEGVFQTPADPKGPANTKNEDSNPALAASLLSGSLATPAGPPQASAAPKPCSESEVKSGSALVLSVPKSASTIPLEIAATVTANAGPVAKSAKATPVGPPPDFSHPADVALPAPGSAPDTKKMVVPVPPDEPTVPYDAEQASSSTSMIANAAPLLTSAAAKVSKDLPSARAGPDSVQAAASGVSQGRVPAASRIELARPAPAMTPVSVADQFQNQVSAHLDQLRQMGRVEVQLDLHPPELGRVQLHLAIEDGHMNVRIVVQDDAVKRVMDQQLEPLRVRFSEMGVSVGQFDVRRDGSSANQHQQPASEPSAQAIQTDKRGPVRHQKAYGRLVYSNTLVDVMA